LRDGQQVRYQAAHEAAAPRDRYQKSADQHGRRLVALQGEYWGWLDTLPPALR